MKSFQIGFAEYPGLFHEGGEVEAETLEEAIRIATEKAKAYPEMRFVYVSEVGKGQGNHVIVDIAWK